MRLLFCLANSNLTGANMVLCELASRLRRLAHDVELYVWQRTSDFSWFREPLPINDMETFQSISEGNYDLVIFSSVSLLPLGVPYLGGAKSVLMYQGHESYLYGSTLAEMQAEKSELSDLLPIASAIIVPSYAVQNLLMERFGQNSIVVPPAIDHELFSPDEAAEEEERSKRILMVGSYMAPVKGMQYGFEALSILANQFPLTLVLVTQEKRGRSTLRKLPFEVELHYRPPRDTIGAIYRSCDVYCCPSVYEGFGLPAIEAFACGLPVVSTRNSGVSDFGIDGTNLLLADVGDSVDLSSKLQMILSDRHLASRLRKAAFPTAAQYTWDRTMAAFVRAIDQIALQAEQKPLDEEQANQFLGRLESAGRFTPASIRARLREIADEFETVCRQITNRKIEFAEAQRKLIELRDETRGYLANPHTEYFQAFKTRHDMCRMLIACDNLEELTRCAVALTKSTHND